MVNDWIEGDLLKIVASHYLAKADMEKPWPDVFLRNDKGNPIYNEEEQIQEGTIVLAMDRAPSSGQRAHVRVVHNGGVWVANSNRVVRVWPNYE